MKVLGRLGSRLCTEWSQYGLWYEADHRHAGIIVREQGLDQDKVRSELPGEGLPYEEEDEELLPTHEVKKCQALVARANHLSLDRSDI